MGNSSFEKFKVAVDATLKKYVPLKKRYVKAKQTFFGNVNDTDVTAKTFLRTIEPLFTGKVTALSRIALIEKKEV